MPNSVGPLPVVLLTGPPASGKSTVGRALARDLGAALVDQDTATAPLTAVVADLVGVHDLDDERLAGPTRAARYETVLALTEDNLRAGTAVVLVAPFSAERRDPQSWDLAAGRLRAAGGDPLLVWLRLDAATIVHRLRARGAERDVAKLADEAGFAAALDVAPPVVAHVEVDAAGSTEQAVRQVLTAFGK
jgi:predicted kinase